MQLETNRSMKYKQVKNKNKKRLGLKLLLGFFILSGVAAGTVWWQVDNTLDQITTDEEPKISQEDAAVPVNYNQEPVSMVIIGRDSREGLGLMNTDVMIVAALNPKTKHVTMMSIPRDTGVKIPGYSGYHKINSVYAKGERERRIAEQNGKPVTETGPSLVKKTLEDALGIPINYYTMIDFEGFEKVIDKLGGVEVNVEKSMKYDDPTDGTHINLEPGLQVLDGDQALDYVRHRKDNRGSKYFSTDFDRGNRQQIVIKSMVDKMKSFTGISSFFSVMNVAGEHIRTDLSKDQIKGLVLDFKSVGSENITSMETGGYWDRASSHTIIPKENLRTIQLAFQQEMELEDLSFESNLRVEGGTRERAAEPPNSTNPKPKPAVTQEAAEEVPPSQADPDKASDQTKTAETDDPGLTQKPAVPDATPVQQETKPKENPEGTAEAEKEASSDPKSDSKPTESEPVQQPSTTSPEPADLLKPPVGAKPVPQQEPQQEANNTEG